MYNVTVFLLFFMSLYGFLGVQFFGDELNYHCVLNTANETHITKQDLAIPDSYCNPAKSPEDQCPSNMKCIRIASSIQDDGGYAGFESFLGQVEKIQSENSNNNNHDSNNNNRSNNGKVHRITK
ncbi:unnamed protein product [Trichobilharzia regenti]|nr:unnamed protein product [Trichobilharzia regenti]